MDPLLLAHAMKLIEELEARSPYDRSEAWKLTAGDMLDYLGKKIDEDKARETKAIRT